MNALILIGTLQKDLAHSNTAEMAEQLAVQLRGHGAVVTAVALSEMGIDPTRKGTLSGPRAALVRLVKEAHIIVFATPIWWNNHSSLIQAAIETLDDLQDQEPQVYAGKVGGVIVVGHEDGVQHVTGNLLNVMHWLGIAVPPQASVTWVGEQGADMKTDAKRRRASKSVNEMFDRAAHNLVEGARTAAGARYWT